MTLEKRTKEKKKQILLYITEKNNAQQKAFHKVMPTEWMVHFTLSCYCCRWCSFISRNMGFCSVSFVIVLKTDHPLEQNEVSFSLSKLCLISKNARFWSVSFKISPKTGHVLEHTHTIWRRKESYIFSIQTHKRFRRTLFIRTKTQSANFWANPLCQATKRHLNNS